MTLAGVGWPCFVNTLNEDEWQWEVPNLEIFTVSREDASMLVRINSDLHNRTQQLQSAQDQLQNRRLLMDELKKQVHRVEPEDLE